MTIDHVVLDFDGTCTQVGAIEAAYLKTYFGLLRAELLPSLDERTWKATVAGLRKASPAAGWMLAGAAPSAPLGADPYIVAGEAAGRLLAAAGHDGGAPGSLHQRAYDRAQAPFRPEAARVLERLVYLGVNVWFVSNSSSSKIGNRIDDLLAAKPDVRKRVRVESDAAKFSIREIALEAKVPASLRKVFGALPAGVVEPATGRPIYLRRGRYFQALCHVWGNDPKAIANTLVCGDVWELDLAMPEALGAQVHLITREKPYPTYPYERAHAKAHGISDDLDGMLTRVAAARGARLSTPGTKTK